MLLSYACIFCCFPSLQIHLQPKNTDCFSFLWQVVAITVFCLLVVAFYAFFAPFLGGHAWEYAMIAVYSPVVCQFSRISFYFRIFLVPAWPSMDNSSLNFVYMYQLNHKLCWTYLDLAWTLQPATCWERMSWIWPCLGAHSSLFSELGKIWNFYDSWIFLCTILVGILGLVIIDSFAHIFLSPTPLSYSFRESKFRHM